MGRRSRTFRKKLAAIPVEVEVEVTALASGGSCVGTILAGTSPTRAASDAPADDDSAATFAASLIGKKIFTPYCIPGEVITARVTMDHKSYCEGELVSIRTASPNRVAPHCPHFGSCGGCDLQHISLPFQREMKRQMLEGDLAKSGGISPTQGVTLLTDALPGFGYRRRMSFHLNKKGEFGLYKKSGRQIAPLSHCPIATDSINTCLEHHLEKIIACGPEAETVTLEDHEGEIYLAFEVHPRAAEAAHLLTAKPSFKTLCEELKNVQVNYRHKSVFQMRSGIRNTDQEPPIGHFSQNNALANTFMLEEICRVVQTEGVTDLYAGAGNISLPLAAKGHKVHAVELDPHLVEFGKKKAALMGLQERVEFVQMACERWIESGAPDKTVVLDPPRGGAFEVAKQLSPIASPHLVYVSCYPPTFVRDAAELIARGYRCESVKLLDMFPQTYHCELVAEFRAA
jgi:23S rRNA (uracil1939-C5)-methyltransferase